jgi:hypothetical protein
MAEALILEWIGRLTVASWLIVCGWLLTCLVDGEDYED